MKDFYGDALQGIIHCIIRASHGIDLGAKTHTDASGAERTFTMDLNLLRKKRGFICDMDGVIYHGDQLLPGAQAFVEWLKKERKKFLFFTN